MSTITAPLRGQHAVDLDGRDLGVITKRVSNYAYLEDGSRVQLHRLLPNGTRIPHTVQPGVTLYEFPDGSVRECTLEEWLIAGED